jgi:FixJ family two-component response regulator
MEVYPVSDGVVFVVDDDPAVRRALARLFRSDRRQVQTYASASEFLDQPLPRGPACLVLDLQMPDVNGLDLQQLLAGSRDVLPIVFLSGHANIPMSVRAMKEGAIDFLTKPFDDHQLLAAVDAALTRARRAHEQRDLLNRDRVAFETLTPRERQVCVRVARGMLNKEIGAELGTAEKTVKVQRGRVMQKLGAQSVPDVVRLVERLRAAGHLNEQSKEPGNQVAGGEIPGQAHRISA